MTVGAFTTKYYYNAILKKTKILPGGKTADSYVRRHGNQFALSPGGACSAVEEIVKKEGFLLDHIVLRMGGANGQIVFQTQSEDYDAIKDADDWNDILKQANLPHSPIQTAPWAEREKNEPERYFDIYKFLTTYNRSYTHRPTLKVEDVLK